MRARSLSRREFLRTSAAGAAAAMLAGRWSPAFAEPPAGERPQRAEGVEVLNPQGRVPISFIIDDSTCLVNAAYFKIPQFAEVFPDRYQQDWRKLPREIPDAFVRKFGEWCHEHGVKGKYSIIPYPACVGWVDRFLPGWTKRELDDSLALVRDFMTIDWDIHPEMITHTWAIDTKTGRPYPERTADFMENFGFSVGRSADFLADYLAYALRILKNAGLPCEGVTTPGGFGTHALEALSLGTLQAVRDVYQAEIPHYFRHIYTDDRSVAPRVENVSGLESEDPKCVVSIIGCTGDWFGGWDGLYADGHVDRFITEDLQGGRLPQVIDRGEPAILVCHWAGIYYNGEERGFRIFQEAVRRMHERNDNLLWMKLSEIARYWAAKELTRIERTGERLVLTAPFATADFTLRLPRMGDHVPVVTIGNARSNLRLVNDRLSLDAGTCHRDRTHLTMCFDLPKGRTVVEVA
jgi:hypothetical protein